MDGVPANFALVAGVEVGVFAPPLDAAWGHSCGGWLEGLKVEWPRCAGVRFEKL